MTQTRFPKLWVFPPPLVALPLAFNTGAVIAATGAKVHIVGRMTNKDGTSKNITKVGVRLGTVTKAGGSALILSLQDVDVANGPPFRGDATQDQTVAIANANAAFVTGSWLQSAALSATRAVAFGGLVSIVIEYDGAGRLGADTVTISAMTAAAAVNNWANCGVVLENPAGTFTVQTSIPDVILEFDDGTFGTLDGGFPASTITATAFNSGSTPDERALEFTVPVPCKCDAAWMAVSAAAGADFDQVIYNGTTVLSTVSFDANALAANANRFALATFPEIQFDVGNTYRLSCKPTTANNVTLNEFDVNAAGHFQAMGGGTEWVHNTRTDGGAWGTATLTKRPLAGLRLSTVDNGAGSGSSAQVIGG